MVDHKIVDTDLINESIKQDFKRMSEWAVMVNRSFPVAQTDFHLRHLSRKLRKLEGELYSEIHDEVDSMLQTLTEQEMSMIERIRFAEKLTILSCRLKTS